MGSGVLWACATRALVFVGKFQCVGMELAVSCSQSKDDDMCCSFQLVHSPHASLCRDIVSILS